MRYSAERSERAIRTLVGAVAVLAGLLLPWTFALAGDVTWATDANGNWHDPNNWSSAPALPGADSNVTIDRPSYDLTVIHSVGTHTINTLSCAENLTVSGGTLTISATSLITGNLAVSGGTINFNGPASVAGQRRSSRVR